MYSRSDRWVASFPRSRGGVGIKDVLPLLARGETMSPEATLRRPLGTGGRGKLILPLHPHPNLLPSREREKKYRGRLEHLLQPEVGRVK